MSLCNLLRVPPIFIMDELFKTSFGFSDLADIVFPANNDIVNNTLSQIVIGESAQYHKAIFLSFINVIVSCMSKLNIHFQHYQLINIYLFFLVFCSLSCLFVLPTQYLYMVYFHIFSVCIVLLSNSANIETLKVVYGKYENLKTNQFDENIPWDVYEFLNLFKELQVEHFLYLLFRNLIFQCFLSLVLSFLQVRTSNQPIHKVNC